VWIGIGAACALTVLVVVVIALSSGSDSSSTSNSAKTGRSRSAGTLSGIDEQWIELVCRTGTFMDGEGLPDANGTAGCLAKTGASLILMGQYDSEFKMRNAVSQIGAQFYASGIKADGTL
jgi:hypothetical protein